MKEKDLIAIPDNKRDFDQRLKITEICSDCKVAHSIYTQPDNYPEYYSDIHLVCSCGELVTFEIPVN